MEQRIIPLQVSNEYIIGAGGSVGAVGSHDDVLLELDFRASRQWDGTTRRATFANALGEKKTAILLTADLLEEGQADIYLLPVPAEAKTEAGECYLSLEGFVMQGETEVVRVSTENATFRVMPSKLYSGSDGSVTPTAEEQLQKEIDSIKETIVNAGTSERNAKASADAAAASAAAAAASETAAKDWENLAEAQNTSAQEAKREAKLAAVSASTDASSASGSSTAAASSKDAAEAAAAAAAESEKNAKASADAAAASSSAAESAAAGAEAAKNKAQAAQSAAEAAQKSAEGSAESASASAMDAAASASTAGGRVTEAENAAKSATNSAQLAANAQNGAAYAEETARSAATSAKADADTAAASKTAAETAKNAAQSAQTNAESAAVTAASGAAQATKSAAQAETARNTAESWAVGGTGTREGEDTNNAKYWSDVAQGAAGGGVTSFNGRSGAVVPQKGDYTAAMVGAPALDSNGRIPLDYIPSLAFYAVYGTTTNREIESAFQDGKQIYCIKGSTFGQFVARASEEEHLFVCGDTAWRCISDEWKEETLLASATHARNHATGGSDPITPASIGAAALDENGKVPMAQQESEIFVATYGTTTGAEIQAAYEAGKLVMAKKDDRFGVLTLIQESSGGTRIYIFLCGGTLWTCSENQWGMRPALANAKHASTHATGGSDPLTPEAIGAIPTTEKGEASGVASLDENGKVPMAQQESEIFWATYGTTTGEEILAAYEAGKLVIAEKDGKFGVLTRISGGVYVFLSRDYAWTYYGNQWNERKVLANATHASNHATGGSDPITPASIGAAPAYTYGTEDLTAGTSALETGTLYFVYE